MAVMSGGLHPREIESRRYDLEAGLQSCFTKGVNMNGQGILIGGAAFVIIGLFHLTREG